MILYNSYMLLWSYICWSTIIKCCIINFKKVLSNHCKHSFTDIILMISEFRQWLVSYKLLNDWLSFYSLINWSLRIAGVWWLSLRECISLRSVNISIATLTDGGCCVYDASERISNVVGLLTTDSFIGGYRSILYKFSQTITRVELWNRLLFNQFFCVWSKRLCVLASKLQWEHAVQWQRRFCWVNVSESSAGKRLA